MSFFHRLVAETAEEQKALAAVPQIQAGLSGRISLETYIAYLTEAYHHVKHTVPLMETAKALMGENRVVFSEALDEYIAEETGHERWILNDIRNCGGDAEGVRTGAPRPATQAMVDYAYAFIRNDNPMGFFGMVFVLEGTSVQLATQGAEAGAHRLGLPPQCFSYLTSHGSLDLEHMNFFQRLMDQVEDEADQADIIQMARRMFGLFADVFRAIPHQPVLAHAV